MPTLTPQVVPIINWEIEQITTKMKGDYANTNGDISTLEKVAIGVSWRVTATKGNYRATVYNTVSFNPPDPDSFIVYADLNKGNVLDWVWASGVNKEECELYLLDNIKQQELPPVVACLPLPWA